MQKKRRNNAETTQKNAKNAEKFKKIPIFLLRNSARNSGM
jgi:hypothetical protein